MKRGILGLAGVAGLMFFAIVSPAMGGTIQLTNDGFNNEPQIDDGQVVWVHYEANPGVDPYDYPTEIFFYDGAETQQLTNSDHWKGMPQIDRGQVVWSESDGNDREIFLYDSATGSTRQLTDNDRGNQFPQIDRGQVVWEGFDTDDSWIFFYDGHDTHRLGNGYGFRPQIDRGQVVWSESDGNDREIFLYDSATGSTRQLTDNDRSDKFPHIDSGQVVWLGYDGNDWDVFLYDGTDIRQITKNSRTDLGARIDGGQVVWHGYDEASPGQVFFYDAASGNTRKLTNNDHSKSNPRIDRGQVVWSEHEYYGPTDVFLYDTASENTSNVSGKNEWHASYPQIDRYQIVWGDSKTGSKDKHIFLYSDPMAKYQKLAEKYAPMLFFRDRVKSGKNDFYRPMRIESLPKVPNTFLRNTGEPDFELSSGDVGILERYTNSAYYIDFPGFRDAQTARDKYKGHLRSAKNEELYAYVVDEGDGRVHIQYWFYYCYNDWVNDHEGDWEMIQVTLVDGHPTIAAYSQHEHSVFLDRTEKTPGTRRVWDQVLRFRDEEGEHPLVFVGQGSHASFFEPGEYDWSVWPFVDKVATLRTDSWDFPVPDEGEWWRDPDRHVELLGYNMERHRFGWTKFQGRWGEVVGLPGEDGPYGPYWGGNAYKSLAPLDWALHLAIDTVQWPENQEWNGTVWPRGKLGHATRRMTTGEAEAYSVETTDEGHLVVEATWPGSEVDLVLTDPDGGVVDPDQQQGVRRSEGATSERLEVFNAEPGEWKVKVYAEEMPAGGETVTFTADLFEAKPPPPIAEAGESFASNEGDEVFLEDAYVDYFTSNGLFSFSVDWGDGAPADRAYSGNDGRAVPQSTYVYRDNGGYEITLAGIDTLGRIGSDAATVQVENVPPKVDAGSDRALFDGHTFRRSGTFTDPGVLDTHTATVDYGDGQGPRPLSLKDGSFVLKHSYGYDTGTYTVTVTVTDDDGGTGRDSFKVSVVLGPDVQPAPPLGEPDEGPSSEPPAGQEPSPSPEPGSESDDGAPYFSDVANSPYRSAIEGLKEMGVVAGYPDEENGPLFKPHAPIWRVQFAKMLCVALGLEVSEDASIQFRDFGPDDPDDLYPHEYAAAASQAKLMVGITDSLFAPWQPLTRAQAVTVAVRALEKRRPAAIQSPPAGWASTLGDFDPTHGPNMAKAEYSGLLDGLSGFGKTWDPWQEAARGEVAQLLWEAVR